MIRTLIAAAAGVFLFAAGAQANMCPSLMQDVDAKVQSADLSEEQRAEVMELREQGEAQHEAGDHEASVESLQQALEILNQ